MERLTPETITIQRAIELYGFGRTKLYELIQRGDIEAVKLGRRTLLRADSIRAFIDSLPRMTSEA